MWVLMKSKWSWNFSWFCLYSDNIYWFFEFTILYFISSVWLQGYNNYALLISINKLTWLFLNGEHSVHSVFPSDTWKAAGLALYRAPCNGSLSLSLPLTSLSSPHSRSSCSCLLVSVRFKSQILTVLFHHGHIPLFGITESPSPCKQPLLQTTKYLCPEPLCKQADCPQVTMRRGSQASQSTETLAQQYWFEQSQLWARQAWGLPCFHSPLFTLTFFCCNSMIPQRHRQGKQRWNEVYSGT